MNPHNLYDIRRQMLALNADEQDKLFRDIESMDIPNAELYTFQLYKLWEKERFWHLGDYYKLFTDGSQAPDEELIRKQWMRARRYAELCVDICRGQADDELWSRVVEAHATFDEYEHFEFALWLLDSVSCCNDISDIRYYRMITDSLRRLPNEVLYYSALLKRYPRLQLLIVADSLAATQKEYTINRPMWLVCYRALHDLGVTHALTFTAFVNYMEAHSEEWQLLWLAYKLSSSLESVKVSDAHKSTRHYVGYMENPCNEWDKMRDKALEDYNNKPAKRGVDKDDFQLTWPLKNDIHTSNTKLAGYIEAWHLRLNGYL